MKLCEPPVYQKYPLIALMWVLIPPKSIGNIAEIFCPNEGCIQEAYQ